MSDSLEDFDFILPEALIALRPAQPRHSARLLVIRAGADGFEDHMMSDLPNLLAEQDMLVFNNTRVLAAALKGVRSARNAEGMDITVDINLLERLDKQCWRVAARPGRRLRVQDQVMFSNDLSANVLDKDDDGYLVLQFSFAGQALDTQIAQIGRMPLPPYIARKRAADAKDHKDYQTIFARHNGSVAAPTAGLHFDDDLMASLNAKGVLQNYITLHVGAGTFLPVKTNHIDTHKMHSEWRDISEKTAEAIRLTRQANHRVVAVGTTVLRALESAACSKTLVRADTGKTDIFIRPGYELSVCNGLLTNFHLPRSTLFMLVCAIMGVDRMQKAYAYAIKSGYRFFSYGDACLLLP